MANENRIIWITVAMSAIGIIGIFLLLLSSSSGEGISGEKRDEYLVREDTHVLGQNDARIQLVVFEDFQCPACVLYVTEFEKVKKQYGEELVFVFRHFPLRTIHPSAQITSEAAEAAGSQGKFYELHDILYSRQDEWSKLEQEELILKMVEYAEELGLNIELFEAELREGKYTEKVNRDFSDGEKLRVNATPTVFINGRKVSNPTADNISKLIEELK